MRTFAAIAFFTGAGCLAVRADFSYESNTRLSGGVVSETTLNKEVLELGRKAVSATHMFKNNRLVTLTKHHATVVDLNAEKIVEIDFARKTHLTTTFAQMKQLLDAAKARSAAAAAFEASTKAASGSRAFGFFNARQMITTMTRSAEKPGTVAHVLVDSWLLTMPGFSEAEEFRRKIVEKLGYAYATGLSEISVSNPELFSAFEEVGKINTDGDDMPIEMTIRMGGADAGDLMPREEAAQKNGMISETLGRISNLGRKKNSADAAPPPGLLLEMTIELSNFGSGPVDDVKFNVPEGFKELKPPAAKTGQ
jgi:hypothetical protein